MYSRKSNLNFYANLYCDEKGEYDQSSLIYKKIGDELSRKLEYNEI